MCVLKTLTPELRGAFRAMLHKSWVETYTKELGTEAAMALVASLSSDDLAGLTPNKDEKVLIAYCGDTLVGSTVFAARNGVTYVWGCYVLEKFQRRGLGRRLLLKSIDPDEPNNTVQITVLKSSAGAIKFYECLGFQTISENPFKLLPELTVPSITMIRKPSG
ncbi:MAG: GNAT family N-acetyltransferase [Rhizobiaceae bacterium]